VDYSLFIMVAVLVMLERLEKATGGDYDNVSPFNLCWNNLYFVVLCFSAASSRECFGRSLYRRF
jgi:hypothetical protein